MPLAGNSFQIFEFKGVIHKILRNKELACWAHSQDFGRGLDRLTASTSCFHRAPTSGAGAASRSVLVTGTPRPCYRSISIVADGRLEVCAGAHWAFVMKKGCGQILGQRRKVATSTGPPKRSLNGAPSGFSNDYGRAGHPPFTDWIRAKARFEPGRLLLRSQDAGQQG